MKNYKYFWNLSRIFNMTALILAAINGYKEIVELLIRQENIDINMTDIMNHKHFIKFESNFFFIILKNMNISGI